MRAREFVEPQITEDKTVAINIPINITIPSDDSKDVVVQRPDEEDADEIMVPPLQQEVELDKAQAGKHSPVITTLTKDEEPITDDQDDSGMPLAYK